MKKDDKKYRLQGHEKFYLRDGWLDKGILYVEQNPRIFQGKDGPDIFGVGSNMVKSIRYWLRAFGLIEENSSGAHLTEIAQTLRRYDPYFEDVFTLWILQSYIAKNVEEATSWYMFFNRFDVEEFSREDAYNIIKHELIKYLGNDNFSDNSLKTDIDMITLMYGKEGGVWDPEEKNISAMVQLGLIQKNGDKYIKSHPDRRKINEWNILYELSYLMKDVESISIDSVASGDRSVGAIYQIPRVVIDELLDKLDFLEYVRVDRTAGLNMLYKIKALTPEKVVEEYYINHR